MLYAERLRCPASYWIIAFAFGLTFVTAVGWYLGPWFAAGATVVATGGIAAVLGTIGHVVVSVDARGLTVGQSLLEWPYVGTTERLDAAATRERLGVGADVRAFVVQRPYIAEAVEIEVADPADPHPYWLVSSREPARLLQALAEGRAAHAGASA